MDEDARLEQDVQVAEEGGFAESDAAVELVVADWLMPEDCSNDFLTARVGVGFRKRQQVGRPVLRERLAGEKPPKRLLYGDGDGKRAVGLCSVVDEGRRADDADESTGVERAQVRAGGRHGNPRLNGEIDDAFYAVGVRDKAHQVQSIWVGQCPCRSPKCRFQLFTHGRIVPNSFCPEPPHLYKCGGSDGVLFAGRELPPNGCRRFGIMRRILVGDNEK